MDDNFKIHVKYFDDYALVDVEGRLDRNNGPQLKDEFENIKNAGKNKVILNLTSITFLSSYGMWVIFEAYKNIGLAIYWLPEGPYIKRIKKTLIYGWPPNIRVHESLDAALIELNLSG